MTSSSCCNLLPVSSLFEFTCTSVIFPVDDSGDSLLLGRGSLFTAVLDFHALLRHAVVRASRRESVENITRRDGVRFTANSQSGRRNARHLRRVWTDWLDRQLSGITRRPHASPPEIAERLRTSSRFSGASCRVANNG